MIQSPTRLLKTRGGYGTVKYQSDLRTRAFGSNPLVQITSFPESQIQVHPVEIPPIPIKPLSPAKKINTARLPPRLSQQPVLQQQIRVEARPRQIESDTQSIRCISSPLRTPGKEVRGLQTAKSINPKKEQPPVTVAPVVPTKAKQSAKSPCKPKKSSLVSKKKSKAKKTRCSSPSRADGKRAKKQRKYEKIMKKLQEKGGVAAEKNSVQASLTEESYEEYESSSEYSEESGAVYM